MEPGNRLESTRETYHVRIRKQMASKHILENRKRFFQLLVSNQDQFPLDKQCKLGIMELQFENTLQTKSTAIQVIRLLIRLRKYVRQSEDKSFKVIIQNKIISNLVQILSKADTFEGDENQKLNIKKHCLDILASVSKSPYFDSSLILNSSLMDICHKEYSKQSPGLIRSICFVIGNSLLQDEVVHYVYDKKIIDQLFTLLDFDDICNSDAVQEIVWILHNYIHALLTKQVPIDQEFIQAILVFVSNIIYIFYSFQNQENKTLQYSIDLIHNILGRYNTTAGVSLSLDKIVEILIQRVMLRLSDAVVRNGLEILDWSISYQSNQHVENELLNNNRFKVLILDHLNQNPLIVMRMIYNLLDYQSSHQKLYEIMFYIVKLVDQEYNQEKFRLLCKYFGEYGEDLNQNDVSILGAASHHIKVGSAEAWGVFWNKIKANNYTGPFPQDAMIQEHDS